MEQPAAIIKDFPCTCGHRYDDHFAIRFQNRNSILACRECNKNIATMGCIDFTPIPNLEYLEKKYERL